MNFVSLFILNITIPYIFKSTFNLADQSGEHVFPGVWWGHYKDEVPQDTSCDVIVELDFNSYAKRYEVRLIDLRPNSEESNFNHNQVPEDTIIDCRNSSFAEQDFNFNDSQFIVLDRCPLTWTEIQQQYRNAIAHEQKLVLNYHPSESVQALDVLRQFISTVKELAITHELITKEQLQEKISLGDHSFDLGLQILNKVGFSWHKEKEHYQFNQEFLISNIEIDRDINLFLLAVKEEQFQREYFYYVPLYIITKQLA